MGRLGARLVVCSLLVGFTAMASVPAASGAGASNWLAYGHDFANSRSQPDPGRINAHTVAHLKVAWAARVQGLDAEGDPGFVTATPAVAGGLAVWGDWRGDVHAVDVRTGAVRWTTHIPGASYFEQINSSPAIVGDRIFLSTGSGYVVALDRATGKVLWSTLVDQAPDTDLFSSPIVVGSTLVVGVASVQLALPLNPYTFHGSVVALNADSGRLLWRRWVQRPGIDGPGGSVWSTAAADPALGLVYIGTGQGYEPPAGPATDSLLALRLSDGATVWHRQYTSGDVFNFFGQSKGRDYDIGASPNLFDIHGRRVVGVGDKGGLYATLDARTGRTVWRRSLCPGSHLGGVMTTAAVAHGFIWVTCNRLRDKDELAKNVNHTSVMCLDADSGRTVWSRTVVGGTVGGITEAGGVVFVPNTLGTVRAFNERTGRLLWHARPAGPGHRFDHGVAGGVTVAANRVLVPYGYTFISSPDFPKDAVGGVVAYRVP